MTINSEREATVIERRGSPESGIALSRLGCQLASTFRGARKRLWVRMTFVTLSVALALGIGVFVYVSLITERYGAEVLGDSYKATALAAIASLLTVAGLYPVFRRFEHLLLEIVLTVSRINIDLMSMLGKLTELRDENTAGHNKRVTFYMVLFAEALGLSPEEVVRVAKSAFLHDIGKLVVPDRVLDKPGALTPEERVEMENHVLRGAEIVMESQLLSGAAPIVAAHHEHFDGSGYPKGLKGEDIPREARMFALVDVFDALTSPRVYKAALTVEESLNIMAGGRGSHFDPVLFDRFVELAPSFAKQLPKEEGALTTMLMRRLFPYLDCFLLGQSLIEHSKKKRIMTGPISRS